MEASIPVIRSSIVQPKLRMLNVYLDTPSDVNCFENSKHTEAICWIMCSLGNQVNMHRLRFTKFHSQSFNQVVTIIF